MKKLILLVLMALVILSPFANAAISPSESTAQTTPAPTATPTHTVFIEEGTATWCGYCPTAAEALKSLFDNSSAYPFYYVAMVANRNSIAYNRFVYMFKARAYPTVFFDGGYLQQVGVGTTVDQTVSMYRELLINASTKRTVHPLALNTTAVGKGDAKIGITVKVTNTGDSLYVGVLKSCVTEITSRWKDAQGHPYHYGLLDIAFRRLVVLPPQKSKEFTMTWNGAMKHGNLTYADIVDSNILVISSVSHWLPHKIPADGTYVKEHYAFFVDQTDAATVSTE